MPQHCRLEADDERRAGGCVAGTLRARARRSACGRSSTGLMAENGPRPIQPGNRVPAAAYSANRGAGAKAGSLQEACIAESTSRTSRADFVEHLNWPAARRDHDRQGTEPHPCSHAIRPASPRRAGSAHYVPRVPSTSRECEVLTSDIGLLNRPAVALQVTCSRWLSKLALRRPPEPLVRARYIDTKQSVYKPTESAEFTPHPA